MAGKKRYRYMECEINLFDVEPSILKVVEGESLLIKGTSFENTCVKLKLPNKLQITNLEKFWVSRSVSARILRIDTIQNLGSNGSCKKIFKISRISLKVAF